MSANFEIIITGIKTSHLPGMQHVVKKVEFTVKGIEEDKQFELPQSLTLPDPEQESFVPLENLTEAEVKQWVELNFKNMDAVKAHIQYVLDKEVSNSRLESAPLPWAPVPQPPQQPEPTVQDAEQTTTTL